MNGRSDEMNAMYADGRRAGLAIGALATAAVAFISLLGIEKAILAFVLAWMAFGRADSSPGVRKLAIAACIVASVYALTYVVVLVVFREHLAELIRLLQKLG